jgi:hypothetical protein
MKHLQFYCLTVACLTGAVILFILLFFSNTAVLPSLSLSALGQTRSENIDSDLALLSATEVSISEPDLPDTASESFVEFPDRLIAEHPPAEEEKLANLYTFVNQIRNGQEDVIRGVHVSGLFSLPIIQQPKNNPLFVSNKHDRVTQFKSAAQNGVTGLLAHNYLAGDLFYQLVSCREILILYGDGASQRYRVVSIHRYQKLRPASLHSNFVDLDSGEEFSTAEVFRRFYRGDHRLIFQTCLERNGQLDWGLLYVVAVPLETGANAF